MKRLIYLIPLLIVIPACRQSNKNHFFESIQKERVYSKLEKLFLLPADSVLLSYDLSSDSICIFPDLSTYHIKSIDLSGNLLDTIITDKLPEGLESLNLSYNRYKGDLQINENVIPNLKELNLSHNNLKEIYIGEALCKILLSYNDLTVACFNQKNLRYLDISYNSRMSSEVCFEPTWIDTVICDGVAAGERLVGPISAWYYRSIE